MKAVVKILKDPQYYSTHDHFVILTPENENEDTLLRYITGERQPSAKVVTEDQFMNICAEYRKREQEKEDENSEG